MACFCFRGPAELGRGMFFFAGRLALGGGMFFFAGRPGLGRGMNSFSLGHTKSCRGGMFFALQKIFMVR